MTTSEIKTKNGVKYLVTETKLYTNARGEIKWCVHFQPSGWNSVWAKTQKQAERKAAKEFPAPNFEIKEVVAMTPELERSMLSMFW